ncbi:UNVERIFIED_CONTAM: hypothetical protein Sradi_7014300 [Sesamum radiatum]|uniref:Uncharacterized protein n=1 Tax=Sesamum radiatum TaxID=300843 RepID=A0AAW2JC20_SESRA
MDDFKLILGLDFLRDTRTAVLPHVDSLMMMGAKPCVIPTLAGRTGPIPGVIKKLLKEFEDVMPDELPRKLPPKEAVDHKIELVPGMKPPVRAPYKMTQPELVELRK